MSKLFSCDEGDKNCDINNQIDWCDPRNDITTWNVSSVTNMNSMFYQSNFNQPIGNWNVSNVTNMYGMFMYSDFNHPIGNWNVSHVTNMNRMFYSSPFNQPIGNWDVFNVTSMNHMFYNSPFNQDIGNWNVSNVTSMYSMFNESKFNQPLNSWNVSNVTTMYAMFAHSLFNQPIGNWDVSSVIDMEYMFYNSRFNQDISSWNVSNVTGMSSMFRDSRFNQPIGNWDVSNVINMKYMFAESKFKQNLYKWLDRLNLLLSQNSHILGVYKNVDLYHFNIDSLHEKKFGSINSIEDFIEKQKNDMELNDNKPINEQNSDLGYNENDVLYTSFKTLSKEEFNQYISDIDEKTIISFAKDLNPKEWIELVNKIDNPNLKMEILKSQIDIDINSKDEVKENLSNDNKVINININLDLGDLDR